MEANEDYELEVAGYRAHLIAAEQKAQEAYDKTLLTLSGGAFGISFAFADKFVGEIPQDVGWLLAAWIAWAISMAAILFSFFFSNKALRNAIEQVDSGTIHIGQVGGRFTAITASLNIAGGALFVIGTVCLVVFVALNL